MTKSINGDTASYVYAEKVRVRSLGGKFYN